jgi:hypothetical protein
MSRERFYRDPSISCRVQIFGQYIINQYILQNTVEIIHKENFFDAKGKTDEKKTWGLTKIS